MSTTCAEAGDQADTEYIIPEDGTLYWMDTWVIFKDAPHPNAAYAWLNFIQDPQIQAKETETNRYATPNDEAKKLVPPELLNDPAVFVPEDVLESGISSRASRTSRRTAPREHPAQRDLGGVHRPRARRAEPTSGASSDDGHGAGARPEAGAGPTPGRFRSGLLTGLLVLPAAPVVPRPARRADRDRPRLQLRRRGRRRRLHAGGFTLDNYAGRPEDSRTRS